MCGCHVGRCIALSKMMITKKTGKEGAKSQKTVHMDNLCTLKFYRNIILGVTVSSLTVSAHTSFQLGITFWFALYSAGLNVLNS